MSAETLSVPRDLGLAEFLETLAQLRGSDGRLFFSADESISVARAPGRLDVMGGIADYSGSLVLEMPIRDAAFAAVQLQSEPALDVVSIGRKGEPARAYSRTDVTRVLSYPEERKLFSEASNRWAGYVAGAFPLLARERGARFPTGARICIGSTVPEGRGLASSAAIEVAAMSAIVDAFGLDVGAREVARLCHLVENEVVGVPCGPMDQLAVALGEESRLLALLCRPAMQVASVAFPEGIVAVGVDSGSSHSNAGRAYRRARTATFMGKAILERHLGPLGYLTELEPGDLGAEVFQLPDAISGAEYLERCGAPNDASSVVEPGERYPVRAAVTHAVEEHRRVQEFADLLPRARGTGELERLGNLMNLAHCSYSACGLGSTQTDDLASMLRSLPGVYGARVSGGGSGGTVAVLMQAESVPALAEVARDRGVRLIAGSSPGARLFGIRRVRPSRARRA